MENMIPALSNHYQKTLEAIAANDLGRAFILARNGLSEAEVQQSRMNLCAHQGLFVLIHLKDQDFDSARRALKLMKVHLELLSGDELSWCANQFKQLSLQLDSRS